MKLLRRRNLSGRLAIPAWLLAAVVALFVTLANNRTFLDELSTRLDLHSVNAWGVFVAVPLLTSWLLFVFFLIVGAGRVMKPALIFALIVSALVGYFVNEYGIVFDEDMIRNINHTFVERNGREAWSLASAQAFFYILLWGVVPAVGVGLTNVRRAPLVKECLIRTVAAVTGLIIAVTPVLSESRYFVTFATENRDLRQLVTPHYALASAEKYFRHTRVRSNRQFHEIGQDAHFRSVHSRPTIGIFVVGESARADHFSLNGYKRRTNPKLEADSVVSFTNAKACGTATAVSVPCLFSLKGQSDFDVEDAAFEANVLDLLQTAGVQIIWLEGNSGCKRVCDRVDSWNVRNREKSANFIGSSTYFDEELVVDMSHRLADVEGDTLIVLHMAGSHGPAYSEDSPEEFGAFEPICEDKSPLRCSREELINAYDNSILYADHIIHNAIQELRKRADKFNAFLLYASDHGESLGENGVYLHGLPLSLAPDAQTHIPVIFWMSPEFADEHHLDSSSLAATESHAISHDNLSHGLLGLFDVESNAYEDTLDLFRGIISMQPRSPVSAGDCGSSNCGTNFESTLEPEAVGHRARKSRRSISAGS